MSNMSNPLRDLDNSTYQPPNDVVFTVSGLVSDEDRVLVGPRTEDSEGNEDLQLFTINEIVGIASWWNPEIHNSVAYQYTYQGEIVRSSLDALELCLERFDRIKDLLCQEVQ
jgi:hypothetical protein